MTHTDPRLVTGLRPEPLDTPAVLADIERQDCGAVVTFEGRVRSPNNGQHIIELVYEAYEERASAQLQELACLAVEKYGLGGVAAIHRTGSVPTGEVAVVVAVVAAHRREAFEATAWLIDMIKAEVAIWKKEVSPNGATWVGLDDCEVSDTRARADGHRDQRVGGAVDLP